VNVTSNPTARRTLPLSLALTLLVLAGLELAFRTSSLGRALEQENLYAVKAEELSKSEDDIHVVFTGDSRILHGLNPEVVAATIERERGEKLNVYNAGLPGSPPMGQLAMLRRLLTRERPPRLAVMSISPYMFSSRINVGMARESLTTIYRLSDLSTALHADASAEDLAAIATANVFHLYRFRPRLLDALFRFRAPGPPAGTGLRGFFLNGEADSATQDARARMRGDGYRIELLRPEAQFGNEHMGYFVEALRQLKSAGVKTLVLNSLSATQVDIAYGPMSIYEEHIAWTRARVAEFGAIWADVKRSPAITDVDFVDGDHLGGSGAHRFSAWLAHEHVVPALGGRRPDRPPSCKPLFTFDGAVPQGWTVQGSAFSNPSRAQAGRLQWPVYGYVGRGFWSTYGAAGDGDTGEATSPPFVLDGDSLRIRVGGGGGPSQAVSLIVDGQEVASLRGLFNEAVADLVVDTRALRGKSAVLSIRDGGSGVWEHLNVDDAALCP
jgi:hypothetical protein